MSPSTTSMLRLACAAWAGLPKAWPWAGEAWALAPKTPRTIREAGSRRRGNIRGISIGLMSPILCRCACRLAVGSITSLSACRRCGPRRLKDRPAPPTGIKPADRKPGNRWRVKTGSGPPSSRVEPGWKNWRSAVFLVLLRRFGLLRQFLLVRGTSLWRPGPACARRRCRRRCRPWPETVGARTSRKARGGGSEGTHGKSPRMSSPVVCAGATVAPVTH